MPPTLDHAGLVRLVLRSRPATVAEAGRLTGLADAELAALLDELAAEGRLAFDGERLQHRSPQAVVAASLDGLLGEVLETLSAGRDRAQALLDDLPALLQEWSLGEAGGLALADVAHGPEGARELWLRQVERGLPQSTLGCLPDLSWIDADDFIEQVLVRMAGVSASASILVSTSDAADAEQRAKLEKFIDAGLEVRATARPPSWFGLNADGRVALPATWGESWPSSVIELEHPTLSAVMRCLFDLLWVDAQPMRTHDQSWEPLLRLMRRGATLESASRVLGIAPRTGRRRVAAAMEHYGTSTLFELGAAYAAARGRAGQAG